MNLKLAVLPGDGIGQEVTTEALKVLQVIAQEFGHTLETEHGLVGGAALDVEGVPISDATMQMCKECFSHKKP